MVMDEIPLNKVDEAVKELQFDAMCLRNALRPNVGTQGALSTEEASSLITKVASGMESLSEAVRILESRLKEASFQSLKF